MPESHQLLPPGLLAGLPTATSSGSRRAPPSVAAPAGFSAALRKASVRSTAARRPGVRPSAAWREPVRCDRPAARERRGEGEGRKREGAVSSWAASSLLGGITPALPSESAPPPLIGPPHPYAGSLRATTVLSICGAAPPASVLLTGSSHPNSWLLPSVSILGESCSTLLSVCPPPTSLSAAPGPQLLTQVWAMSHTTLWPRPGPWWVDGRQKTARREEHCVRPEARPGDSEDQESAV